MHTSHRLHTAQGLLWEATAYQASREIEGRHIAVRFQLLPSLAGCGELALTLNRYLSHSQALSWMLGFCSVILRVLVSGPPSSLGRMSVFLGCPCLCVGLGTWASSLLQRSWALFTGCFPSEG